MFKFRLISVGKLKESAWLEAQEEFSRRLGPYARIEIIEVAPEATSTTVNGAQSMKLEGERLQSRLSDTDFVIALDRLGKEIDSQQFASLLRDEGEAGRTIAFVIGGAEGLDANVLARCDRKISLSKMTFTHEMARVFLLEQVYRAMTILAGKPYHR